MREELRGVLQAYYIGIGGNVVWGNILGDIENQIDLMNQFDTKVPVARELTINGVTHNLSSNRSWTIAIPDLSSYVPYTGATQDVNLGEFGIQLGNLEFDNTPTNVPTGAGSLVWNDTDGTLDLGLKGGLLNKIGQQVVVRARNNSGSAITKGSVVKVVGVAGGFIGINLALGDSDANSATTFGIVAEDIANASNGFVSIQGIVHGLNTNSFTEGDVLYLSPTVAGTFTNVKPVAPQHAVVVGYVAKKNATDGHILMHVQNGYELNELHNVKIATPANNNVLAYTLATDIWENKTVESALGFTPVVANSAITGATKTKITYDAKGLVTAGADATTADIAASTNKNYVTDAQLTVIGNTSGTNSGNQTLANTSNATSHTVTLSATGGSVQLVEGSGITLTTTGTSADGIITIASSGGGGGSTFADNVFEIYDNTDNTKKLAFQASGITTGTTRTLTIPNASGTIALTSDLASYVPYTGATGAVNLGANNLTVDTNTLFVDATNNRVGIGTASPTQVLDIATGAIKINNSLLFSSSGSTRYTGNTGLNLADPIYMSFANTSTDSFVSYVAGGATSNIYMYWQSSGAISTRGKLRIGSTSGSDVLSVVSQTTTLYNLGTSQFDGLVYFSGTTSAFPALKRNNTELQVRLADDSGFAPIQALGGTFNDNTYIKALGVNQTLTGNFSGVTFAVNTGSMAFAMTGTTFGFYNTAASDLANGQIRTSGLAISNILFGTPHASAILDVGSTTKGFAMPRMTGAQVEAISTPLESLLAYATNAGSSAVKVKGWWGYDGSNLVKIKTGLDEIMLAISDETTALTTGTSKITFRMPYAMKITEVRANLATAQTSGNIFTVDINDSGVSILSTKLTIDNTEKTSKTATTAAVISDVDLADDAEITIDIDQIGNGTAKGCKVTILGYRV